MVALINAFTACKKEPAPEAADAAVASLPPPPKVATVTRYAGSELPIFPSADAGQPLEDAHLDVLAAVEVVQTDAGRAEYYADGKPAGWLDTDGLLTEKPTVDASMKALVSALAKGDSDDAWVQAARAMVMSPDAGLSVRVRAALEERRGPLSPAMKARLDALGAPPSQPAFPPLQPDAQEPAEGGVVWPAVRGLTLKAAASAGSPSLAELPLGAALDVVSAKEDWLEVRQQPATDAGANAPDAGEEPDAGEPADAGVAGLLQGWVPKGAVATEALDAEALKKLARSHQGAGRLASAARALELASALAPDDNALLVHALEADLAAGRVIEAIALSERKPDLSYLKHVTLQLLLGCRGKKAKAEGALDPDKLPPKLPAHACVTEPEYDRCIECWTPTTERDAKRRVKDEANLRESLHKRFPDGPWVKAVLSAPGPQGLFGFFFELPYEYHQGRCDEYTLRSDPNGARISEPLPLPKAGSDAAVRWYEPDIESAVYGFMVAHSADDVRRALASFDDKGTGALVQLAPAPNVARPIDTCGDCASCGD
jgi:hypothetical protein